MSANVLEITRMNLPPVTDMDGGDTSLPPQRSIDAADAHTEDKDHGTEPENQEARTEDRKTDPADRKVDTPDAEHSGSAPRSEQDAAGEVAESAQTASEDLDELGAARPQGAEIKAKQWDELEASYVRDPVTFVTNLLRTVPAHQVADVLERLGIEDAPPTQAEAFQPDPEIRPEELFVQQHQDAVRAAATLPRFQQDVHKAIGTHSQYLNELLYQNALLQSHVQALVDASELKLPSIDRNAVESLVRRGVTYADALNAIYSPRTQKAVQVNKAQASPQPRTPMNGSSAPRKELPDNASFYDIYQSVKRELGSRR